jgi:RNA polymerase sigma-70 factor, ECF subfamily
MAEECRHILSGFDAGEQARSLWRGTGSDTIDARGSGSGDVAIRNAMPEDSQKLVERASKGETPAIEALLERHLPALRAFLRLRAGDEIRARESVSDLVQSVCREVLQDVGTYRYQGEPAFRRWLYLTALHKVMDRGRYLERRRRASALEIPASQRAGSVDEAQLLDCYATFSTPSQDAMVREQTERIEKAFDELPEEYREVITLARIVGLPYADIAEQMNRSDDAVRKLLARALARLGRILDRRN